MTPRRRLYRFYRWIRRTYRRVLGRALRWPLLVAAVFILLLGASYWLFSQIPTEYAPKEDRGAFFVIVNGPEGATYDYMRDYMDEIEARLMPMVDSGEVTRLLVRTPRGFGNIENFNSGIVIAVLEQWDQRRSAWETVTAMPEDLVTPESVPETQIIQQETVAQLLQGLAQLSERDQEIISLKFAGRLSNQEIGHIMELKEKTVSVVLLRAMRRLQQQVRGIVS